MNQDHGSPSLTGKYHLPQAVLFGSLYARVVPLVTFGSQEFTFGSVRLLEFLILLGQVSCVLFQHPPRLGQDVDCSVCVEGQTTDLVFVDDRHGVGALGSTATDNAVEGGRDDLDRFDDGMHRQKRGNQRPETGQQQHQCEDQSVVLWLWDSPHHAPPLSIAIADDKA